ncbi:flagellar basal-body M-ring protein/flagellar hook-basal body protein FliF [Desulfosporosinus acidiphilus SJ4]|uniref:Flagellar M-ring protein n=1 Tax=Desulfosporosinus acidiphilus (strain DSM 22704 / JCM 16185 / SJ4) TaxID=646529 RepID=I4DA84_DESAJ|nr:flagellar basal-body MS-ring/collar protein FliF [Desulfosporosinus acidiphilus]AFM42708.1 flagellar basal-body M-ring protein/flagellar hook-basal body protein FliF [Desulfosporosinus acidiphilus SJ4]
MDYSWAGIKTSVKNFWNKLSRPQKVITVVAPLLVLIAMITLISWASRPQYVAIFTKLTDSDAGAITTKLKDLKVDYQLQDNGATILVPQQSASEIRLELANAGLPQTSKFSFAYLDTMHLGETDADRKLRYTLGLQNELEDTLKTLNGVQDARVQLVMPDDSLFTDNQKATTAAVTLKLAPGTQLGEDQIRAIANLISGSVEGLKQTNVTIVDTNGNVLSDILGKSDSPNRLTQTQYQLEQSVESDMQKSVQSMLDRVLGPNETIVRINADLNFDQIKRTKQTYGPGAIVSQQNSTENTTNGSAAGGTPGLTANGPPTYQAATQGVSSSTKSTNTINNQVDSTQEEQVVNPGAIKRLSVSVMADSSAINQNQLNQIKSIVSSAAGIDLTRGDQIQVAALPFNKTALQQEQQAMANAQQRQQMMTYAEIGAGVLLGLLVIIGFAVKRARKARASRMLSLNTDQPVTLADAERLLSKEMLEQEAEAKLAQQQITTEDEILMQKTKEAVEKYSQNNPAEVARLVKTWLAEES